MGNKTADSQVFADNDVRIVDSLLYVTNKLTFVPIFGLISQDNIQVYLLRIWFKNSYMFVNEHEACVTSNDGNYREIPIFVDLSHWI